MKELLRKVVTNVLSRRVLTGSAKRFVFLYHDISDPDSPQYSSPYSTQERKFKLQVDLIAKHFRLVSLEEVVAANGNHNERLASMTFDDGFLSVKEKALPYLQAKGIPFTVFVNSNAIKHNYLFYGSDVPSASGGLGTHLVAALAGNYDVVALVNRQPLEDSVRGLATVREIQTNISAPGFEDQLATGIDGRSIYGLVHASWPGAPRGSLLQSDDEVINSQLAFGTTVTVRLARILFEHAHSDGGRFVAVSSTAGTFKPYLPLSVYSLAKACLEHTVKLLAPELARKKVTINAVSPSFLPVGINKQVSQRQIMAQSAAVPLGRLCSVEDVVGTINYLLSPEASFVSGQVLMLTGGQL